MKEEHRATYDKLNAQLKVNLLRLDQELSIMPQLVQEAAELSAELENEEGATKLALDIIEAETAARLREIPVGGKPPSETRVFAELVLDPTVQGARAELALAKLDSSRGKALYNSMRDKRGMIGHACDMTVGGYMTTPSYTGRRTQQRAQEAEEDKKE